MRLGENRKQKIRLLRQMERIARGRVNDAVKLAFLDGDELERIDGLDLSALAEFRRSGNGAVEIKLTDRSKALERLVELCGESEAEQAEALFGALGRAAENGDGGGH